MNPEIADELKRIGKEEQKVNRRKMLEKRLNKTYDFLKFKIRAFGNAIKNGIITMYMPNDEHNKFAKSIKEFTSKTKLSNPNMKKEKDNIINSAMPLLKGRKMVRIKWNILIIYRQLF